MTFERSAFESSKPFIVVGVLAACLRVVAFVTEPLKVVERVIVAGNDVVALGAYPVASGGVCGGLALAVGSCSDLASDGRPVGGESGCPCGCVPCHAGHLLHGLVMPVLDMKKPPRAVLLARGFGDNRYASTGQYIAYLCVGCNMGATCPTCGC